MWSEAISILAIDDDPEDLHMLQRYVRNIPGMTIQLHTCTNRSSAKELLAKESVDLVFLDYILGESNGLEILREIRTANNERPVVILTGQGDEAIAAESLKGGASDYLVKGALNAELLRHTIESVLRQHDLQRKNILLEEELQEARKMESIATLAGGLAHDFNNLLTAILGEASLAETRSSDEKVQKHLSRVNALGQQMAEQIRKLMDFSQRRRQPTGFVSLRKVLDDLSVVFDHSVPKTIELETNIEAGGQYVFADESALQQILTNLVTNARDAIDGVGRIEIHVGPQVVENGENEGNFVCITVRDTGCGIDSETRGRIFDPFFTTKPLSSRKGTGLGLALVWQLVEGYGGEVSVESTPGEGSLFRVLLPAGKAESAAVIPEVVAPEQKAKLILVVDDEEALRSVTCDLLEHLGYHTMAAGDGEEALEIYRKHHKSTSLVLLDIAMPKMSGVDCIQKLLEIEPTVPVIFASGHDMEVRTDELKGLGARGVVQKPFQMKDLATRIRSVLDEASAA